jgi:aminotransferase
VCQLPVPNEVLQGAHRALDNGVNRYTNPYGLINLRTAISKKLREHNGIEVDPETEIAITCGGTGAFEGICAALLDPGDTVVSFSPYYPYFHNALLRHQANIRYVQLSLPNWSFNFEQLDRLLTPDVKFLYLNTPSNPTGKVFSMDELQRIGDICRERDILVVADEIYQYMIYDGRKHVSIAALPGMKDNVITMGGYSKTFAITGWRIGYMVAPRPIMEKAIRLVDNMYVCAPAPLQQGVADAIEALPESFYSDLKQTYTRKRHFIGQTFEKLGLNVLYPQGSYYVIADFRQLFPELNSKQFVDRMIEKTRVGAVPADDFVADPQNHKWVRVCFALPDEELERAANYLPALAS